MCVKGEETKVRFMLCLYEGPANDFFPPKKEKLFILEVMNLAVLMRSWPVYFHKETCASSAHLFTYCTFWLWGDRLQES